MLRKLFLLTWFREAANARICAFPVRAAFVGNACFSRKSVPMTKISGRFLTEVHNNAVAVACATGKTDATVRRRLL
jgi:hypothetical protein